MGAHEAPTRRDNSEELRSGLRLSLGFGFGPDLEVVLDLTLAIEFRERDSDNLDTLSRIIFCRRTAINVALVLRLMRERRESLVTGLAPVRERTSVVSGEAERSALARTEAGGPEAVEVGASPIPRAEDENFGVGASPIPLAEDENFPSSWRV